MSQRQYLLTSQRGRWQFEVDGELFGPYKTERDAMLAAQDDAQQRNGPTDPAPVFLVGTSTGAWRPATGSKLLAKSKDAAT